MVVNLVEARGVEPLSAGKPAKASTSVSSGLISRKGLPEAGCIYTSTVVIPGFFGSANRKTGSLISRCPD